MDKELERLWWVTSCTPLHSCAVRCFSCGAPRPVFALCDLWGAPVKRSAVTDAYCVCARTEHTSVASRRR